MLTDENGECIETASNLKAKFEALRLLEEAENKKQEQQPAKKFVPKRFKVRCAPYGSESNCLSFDEGDIILFTFQWPLRGLHVPSQERKEHRGLDHTAQWSAYPHHMWYVKKSFCLHVLSLVLRQHDVLIACTIVIHFWAFMCIRRRCIKRSQIIVFVPTILWNKVSVVSK